MAVTLVVENVTTRGCSFPLEETQSSCSSSHNSYYKFYQLKLRQVALNIQQREEQEAKAASNKRKQIRYYSQKKRSCKDYMHHARDKFQQQPSQKSLHMKDEDQGQGSGSVVSISNRRTKDAVTFTITSSAMPITAFLPESKPKPMVKTKKAPVTAIMGSMTRPRIISAPTDVDKSMNEKSLEKSPTIGIGRIQNDDVDDLLPSSNGRIYTEATSSSSFQICGDENHQSARQSILHDLMIHLNSNPPDDVSKWDVYRNYGDKFSASVSSKIYRDFERVVL